MEEEERLERETERKNVETEEKNIKKQIEDKKQTSQSESSLFPPYFIGACVIGNSHIKKNIPCQDAFEYTKLPFNCGVIAVADGLGSALKSDVGANTMVRAGVRKTRELLKAGSNKEFNLKYIAMEAMNFAREEIISKSISEKCKPSDLACTAMIVVFDEDKVVAAHIGDGAVVAKRNNELLLLSEPVNSEYINEVTPLTSENWKESVRCSSEFSGIDCIAVFTDGCNHAAFRKTPNGIIPHDGFFMPLFLYAQKVNDIVQGENQINSLLTSEKFSEYSDDDKTLVVSVLKKGSR